MLPKTHPQSNPNGSAGCTVVQAPVHDAIYVYFDKQLGLPRGWQSALIARFMEELYEVCRQEGIAPSYDPGNTQRVAAVLSRLTFNKPESDERPIAPTSKSRRSRPAL